MACTSFLQKVVLAIYLGDKTVIGARMFFRINEYRLI
jgi:hypothetical protein